jgi:hypothetical protein
VKRDFTVVNSCQYMVYKSVSIWNLFYTMADYSTDGVEVIAALDRLISGFQSWQQKSISCPSIILSYII